MKKLGCMYKNTFLSFLVMFVLVGKIVSIEHRTGHPNGFFENWLPSYSIITLESGEVCPIEHDIREGFLQLPLGSIVELTQRRGSRYGIFDTVYDVRLPKSKHKFGTNTTTTTNTGEIIMYICDIE